MLMTGAGMAGLTMFASNAEDPYVTEPVLGDEDDEIDDFVIKPTDNLVIVGRSEEMFSQIDAYGTGINARSRSN